MARAKGITGTVVLEELLDDFNIYDQYVDVVSAFEWLFTEVTEIAETVRHFERFPRIHVEGKPHPLRPDFTVVYTDGTGFVGEISKLALHENSVDKLCTQIGNYAALDRLPVDDKATLVSVTDLDVLQLVPTDVGLPAVDRIIRERFLNPDHPYKPGKAPVIAQFSRSSDRDESRYTFQHIPDPDNGVLPNASSPGTIGHFLTKINNLTADRFNRIKASRKFMNDPIKPLYLATHLWQAHWPTEFGATTDDVDVEPGKIAETLKQQFGKGRVSEVKEALSLLGRAGLAADNGDGTWTVSRKTLRLRGERDIHRIIATKAAKKASAVVQPRTARTPRSDETAQATLF